MRFAIDKDNYMLYNILVNLTKGENFMKNETKPSMMTVKQIAKTGLMPENALRQLLKEGKLPVVYIGKKALINYSKLCELLNRLGDTE